MNMKIPTHPLTWPQGIPRSKMREGGNFRTDFDKAFRNVKLSLDRFAKDSGKTINEPVLSSNVNPLALVSRTLSDPGVAVWFTWDDLPVCIAVDRYATPAANLQAIHLILEARRVELRHGTLSLVRQSLQGFRALPAPPGGHWRDVLGIATNIPVTPRLINECFRAKAAAVHPDQGGSDEAMARLNAARAAALSEVA